MKTAFVWILVLVVFGGFLLCGGLLFISSGQFAWSGHTAIPDEKRKQLEMMLFENARNAELDPMPESFRVTHFWQGDAVPRDAFDSSTWGNVQVESLARVEILDDSGRPTQVQHLFLNWTDSGPYVAGLIQDPSIIPQDYR